MGLYGGLSFGFAEIQLSREDVRATQILEERMEVLRLFNWDQVVNQPGYIPATFTAPFYAANPSNSTGGGFVYSGTVIVTNAPITENYSNDLRMIQVQVTWTSGKLTRTRQMTTFVSQYGVQKYVY